LRYAFRWEEILRIVTHSGKGRSGMEDEFCGKRSSRLGGRCIKPTYPMNRCKYSTC
jgi:hypothetical protein